VWLWVRTEANLDSSIESDNDGAFHKDWIWLGMSTSVLMYLLTMSLPHVAFTALIGCVMIPSKHLSIYFFKKN
jgi:hypothetical protein